MIDLRELAIEALKARRAAIDAEIEELRTTKRRPVQASGAETIPSLSRDHLTPEARRRQAAAMRIYWAKRKKEARGK